MKIHLIAQGRFGPEVAGLTEQLAGGRHEITTTTPATAGGLTAACWGPADLRVLLAGRESQGLARYLDRTCHEERVNLLIVTRDHPRLVLGPLVLPGRTACATCAAGRADQHDATRAAAAPLRAAYDRDLTLEPAGHLPSHLRLAAAHILSVADALQEGSENRWAGTISTVNLHDGSMRRSTVVGIHGCPRCRQTPPLADSTWRSLTHLGLAAAGDHRG